MSNVASLAIRRAALTVIPVDPDVPDERTSPSEWEIFEAVRIAMAAAALHRADPATAARMAIDAISAHATVALIAK